MKRNLIAVCFALSASSACISQITEDFEDGDFSGWTTTGDVSINSFKTIGQYSMRLRGGATAERSFASDGDITVHMAATSLENGNFCDVYVSNDPAKYGSALLTISNGQDNGVFVSAETSMSGGTTYIRYVQTGTSADYCYADSITISGGGDPAPNGSISGNGTFGSVETGGSTTSTFTITNNGSADLVLDSIVAPALPFNVESDQCSNTTLSAAASCQFDVRFSPTSIGGFNDVVSVPSNDAELSANLSGFGSDNTPPPPPSGDLAVFSGSGDVIRSALTIAELTGSSLSMMDYIHYSHGTTEINASSSNAAEPANTFEGRLVLNGGNETQMNFNETTPGKNIGSAYQNPSVFPAFDFEFVQQGSHIIPKQRGLIETGHGDWNFIIEPGRVWQENGDEGYSRVAIPFALQEVYANCTHNGMMTFAFKDDGTITDVAVQIGGETCLYFNFEMWGLVSAEYVSATVADKAALIANYEAEVAGRIPTKPISELAVDYPGVIVENIGSEQQGAPTTHGVYYSGVHYAAACSTNYGDYPYCEVMALPSYSTAKTAGAGFAHALLTQQYGETARYLSIADNVPECQDGINGTASIWSDVTVENALDMATGNYRLASYQGDEGSSNVSSNFFLVFGHDGKIRHACERYVRKSSPGTHFSYHSSDTYIAGVAMDNWYGGDLYDKLVAEVYQPLNLSPATYTSVRTQGSPANAFWSHGITWHADDMIKVGRLIQDRGVINGEQVLDAEIMDDMLLQNGQLGLETYGAESTYINTVWTFDMGQRTGAVCPTGSWVSYMSGYGGIGIVMYPNGAVYYYVSDSDAYGFGGAEIELNKIAPICGN